jgi:eukaryotic-like serine/threonine-protein kinase
MVPMHETHQVLAGRFELAGVVGRGGMGTVYRATDLVLGRTVAVKVLAAALLEDPVQIARFEREARAAASLSHPNVVAVYDTGVDDGARFIVMEFVSGASLAELIGDHGGLDADRALRIAARVADALSAAHAAGLVHRDVKPANVMLTADGGVKVLDFGIARALDATALTQTASVLGTAAYMSPEQALGDPADARSDIYSLGCLLYALLVGRPPFAGEVPLAITHQHVHADPVALRTAEPRLPAALDELVMQMLSKSPAARPQTAAEVRDRLAAMVGDGAGALPATQLAEPPDPAGAPPATQVAGAADPDRPGHATTVRPSAPVVPRVPRAPRAAVAGAGAGVVAGAAGAVAGGAGAVGGGPGGGGRGSTARQVRAGAGVAPTARAAGAAGRRRRRIAAVAAGGLVLAALVLILAGRPSGSSGTPTTGSSPSASSGPSSKTASTAPASGATGATSTQNTTATTTTTTTTGAPAAAQGGATGPTQAPTPSGGSDAAAAAVAALTTVVGQAAQAGTISAQAATQLTGAIADVVNSLDAGNAKDAEHKLGDLGRQAAMLEQNGQVSAVGALVLNAALRAVSSAAGAALASGGGSNAGTGGGTGGGAAGGAAGGPGAGGAAGGAGAGGGPADPHARGPFGRGGSFRP